MAIFFGVELLSGLKISVGLCSWLFCSWMLDQGDRHAMNGVLGAGRAWIMTDVVDHCGCKYTTT